MMRKAITLFWGLVLWTGVLSGQWSKVEAGFFLGGSNYQGDVVKSTVFLLDQTSMAYGLHLRYNFSPQVSLRGNLMHTDLQGNDANFFQLQDRGYEFKTPLTELSFQLEYDLFGDQRYENQSFRRILSPYVFVGLGATYFKPQTHFGNLDSKPGNLKEILEDQNADYSNVQPVIPLGLGIKIDLAEQWLVGVEFGMRKTFTDYLDGVSRAGNPGANDWYIFYGANLTYRFALRDIDKDGIVDDKDLCPEQFGLASLKGCPDADGDMVTDQKDLCPDVPGSELLMGCPDSDDDGVVDHLDNCPKIPGIKTLQGCPDYDGDGVSDADDLCPSLAGLADRGGCPFPDMDGDGVEDNKDDCPQMAGLPENKGCPKDRDNDGIVDSQDLCPDVYGLQSAKGCPDQDRDGVTDDQDECPNEFGLAKYDGCPRAFSKDAEVFDLNVRAIWFEPAETNIKTNAITVLDETAIMMLRNPGLKLRIIGFADSNGNELINQQLSEVRAKECFDYLVSLGIDLERMIYQGYGEASPLGNNETPEGRRLNRRVEIELLKAKDK